MSRRFVARRFRSLRDLGPEGLGLAGKRARDLALADAWGRAAGPALSRRIEAVRVTKGILVLRAPDRRWAEALAAQIGELAGRLALEAPGLAVRRVKVILVGQESGESVLEVEIGAGPGSSPSPVRRGPARGDEGKAAATPAAEPLERLAERYLAASGRSLPRTPDPARPRRRP